MKPEVITFTKQVPVVDVDGEPIHEGSVLKRIDRDVRGVVTKIYREGDHGPVFAAVGDMNIWEGPGRATVSNAYTSWKHIPHDEQTHVERAVSRQHQGHYHDEHSRMTREEQELYWTILHLLPEECVDWEFGNPPTDGQEALYVLAVYMDELKAGKRKR